MLSNNNKTKAIKTKENRNLRIAIIASRYYDGLINSMVNACSEYLAESGVKKENISVFYAPGSWEIPIISQNAAKTKKYDGIVTFGIIVKGETCHYKILADQTAQALMKLSLKNNIPIAYEILVVEDLKQAKKRANGKSNKGVEGARAIIEAIRSLKEISGSIQ